MASNLRLSLPAAEDNFGMTSSLLPALAMADLSPLSSSALRRHRVSTAHPFCVFIVAVSMALRENTTASAAMDVRARALLAYRLLRVHVGFPAVLVS
ncbi:hypothetical protein K438DRAFT_1968627 [Mycena galopus ATCC 62051]|nr:hypothetical protein K438DRAFT_1968627 [Mycena galopus ATCC 62051]